MTNFTLPIEDYKDKIVNEFIKNENNILIIKSETGSGKSTLIPQFIADLGYKVVITEPRIVAAVTLAKKVAKDYDKTNIGLVSYYTSDGNNINDNTVITYCTDGIQMTKTSMNNMKNSNDNKFCLIIDEVHEWNINIETLVAYVKYIKDSNNKNNFKVIVMSATIDTEALEKYLDAKTITIPGNNFNVDMIELKERSLNGSNNLIHIIIESSNNGENVLVFQPGKSEIDSLIEDLTGNESKLNNKNNIDIIPLHGDLYGSDQELVWKVANNGHRKIIVSTNIAQTSITIPYIDTVVDNGEAKIMTVDENGIESLEITQISQSDIIQRKGRAGRTKDGKYYLVSNYPFYKRNKFEIPEIQRLSIDKVVLKLASVGIDAEKLNFFHNVDKNKIIASKKHLKSLVALIENNSNNNINNINSSEIQITSVGRKMNIMPIKPDYARMIIEVENNYKDNKVLLGDIIVITAILECGSLVNNRMKDGFNRNLNYYSYNFKDKINENSDLITELNIYKAIINFEYKNLKNDGINIKNFTRIKKIVIKLNNIFNCYTNKKNTSDEKDIIYCVASGMLNNFYFGTEYSREYKDFNDITFEIDKNSIIADNYDLDNNFIFGLPKTIEFKSMYGIPVSKNIINLVTRIDKNIINKFFKIDYIEHYEEARYNNLTKAFTIICEYRITNSENKSINLNSLFDIVGKNDKERFELCKKMSKYIISIENKIFTINSNSNISFIEIRNDDYNTILSLPNKIVKKDLGIISVYYNDRFYQDISNLKDEIVNIIFNGSVNSEIFKLNILLNSAKINKNNGKKLEKFINDNKNYFINGIEFTSNEYYIHKENKYFSKIIYFYIDTENKSKNKNDFKLTIKYSFNKEKADEMNLKAIELLK